MVEPSHRGCSSDEDCPGGHKCCRFEFGPVCVLPVFSEFQLIMDAKAENTHRSNPMNSMYVLRDFAFCCSPLKSD